MRKKIVILTVILCFAQTAFTQSVKSKVVLRSVQVEAPFEMPAINVPDFSKTKALNIRDFGAVAGDMEKISLAIERAIETANKAGGGRVIIPDGEWLTKKIHLKSNVNLHLEKGAVLLFSDNPADYLPAVHTSHEGLECYNYSPLVYAYKCKNVAITGEGELKAKMDTWRRWFSRPQPYMESMKRLYYLAAYESPVSMRQMANDSANLRPHFIQFNRCENVLLDGVKITNSPFWVIHPYLCRDVIIRNVKVFADGHNNDGVDPEMTQNLLIENCIFDVGDDAIAIKSGRNRDSWRLNTPSKNIVIRNCTVINGHNLLALGSELSSGIENVFMDNCHVVDGAMAKAYPPGTELLHLLYIKSNERRGGYVHNIHVSNITSGKINSSILGINTNVFYKWRTLVNTVERKLTPIGNIYLENVKATSVRFISSIHGFEELPVENVHLKNVHADIIRDKEFRHQHVIGVSAIAQDPSTIQECATWLAEQFLNAPTEGPNARQGVMVAADSDTSGKACGGLAGGDAGVQ